MDRNKLEKQLTMLHSDLSKCDRRCKRISKAIGIEENELISYAMKQTEDVLLYIQQLKDKENV